MPTSPFHSVGSASERPTRLRRSCLAVPGSDPKMMARAAEGEADQIFLDLEDAVAPDEKKGARAKVVEALNSNDYAGKVVVVRVNDATTRYMYDDIIEVVRGAHDQLDCLMIPKVQDAGQLWFVENLLNQLEKDLETGHRLGLEVQIETGTGSVNMTEIARVTDRTEALIFGPGDYAADQGVPQLDLGMVEPDYPGHQWHYIIAQITNNARAIGADAVDGPFGDYGDAEGYRESATRAKLLGMDGKWCIHPSQIEIANEVFTPTKDQFQHASELLDAYREAIEAGRGAASFKGKMIDEASRKMAEKLVARGEAAGIG
ncbi:MAG: CoA ester lyase [Actinobacteria bacterium]|nr:CoA ester lyase [Actinomycetota bacterium]